MAEAILIERRFNGPPDSGHAGYTCGRLARFVDGSAAEVTLRQAPPLVKVLAAEADGEGGAVLRDRDTTLAEARPIELDLMPPPPVQAEAAERAAKRSPVRDPDNHPSPTCFVCGPTRMPGDGLRIFAAQSTAAPLLRRPGLRASSSQGTKASCTAL